MPLVCIDCAKEPNIKALIKADGQLGRCEICTEDGRVHPSSNNRFFQLCKALIRFHYNEWDYNTHWGGDGIEALFYGPDNIFFNEERAAQRDEYDDLVLDATQFGDVYEDYNKGVTVFAGYGVDGHQNMLLRSIKSTLDPVLIDMTRRLKMENHFALEEELKAILTRHQHIATTEIKAGEVVYRARVGIEARKSVMQGGFEREYHYAPFTGSQIGAPPPNIASAGRANRAGVSFFYCATNGPTAIAEIRPHPGDRVSMGAFRVKRDLRAYDLSQSQLLHYFESDELLDSYISFNTLSILINKTIPPAERSQYSITQLIADCIRQLGFDAMFFVSTVGSGINAVLFNSVDAELIKGEGKTFLIENVEYTFKPEPVVDPAKEYSEDFVQRHKKDQEDKLA
ncbi:RES family NAD+ phosphorylase [Variovorax atrisoli]|nr:hypothetical protein [Variovorax paradoxus]